MRGLGDARAPHAVGYCRSMDLWQLPIMNGAVPLLVNLLALVLAIVVLVRRWRRRALLWAVVGALIGAAVGATAFFVSNWTNAFGDALPDFVLPWAIGALAASGFALGGMAGAATWRRIVSAVAVIAFLVAAVIGVNAAFGLNPTLGSLFGLAAEPAAALPADPSGAATAPVKPLYETWQPPGDMPKVGTRGSAEIPGTTSGFDARAAGIYLPPAALVKDAPALPLVIMMMGHPGNPDPTTISDVLDQFAAKHNGLAPIVIVADQLGADGNDTACADSKAYGNAKTYVTVDVVAWAKKNLHIIDDPAYWTIAGYSNGGGCAIAFGAEDPGTWKNILDVSGEPFPGSEQVENITKTIYGGSPAKFEASKPVNIMQAAPAGSYAGVTAVFTAGALDPDYSASADTVAAAAKAAGMAVTRYEVPGEGHTGDIVELSLTEGFTVLYPVLGLSAP
jgi:poly(3-hydroxybutyrate) depolymerase